MQVAIVLPDDDVDAIDKLVPAEFPSRAEVVRTAVKAYLVERRARLVDAEYERAYAEVPQAVDDVDAGRARAGRPHPWDDLDW